MAEKNKEKEVELSGMSSSGKGDSEPTQESQREKSKREFLEIIRPNSNEDFIQKKSIAIQLNLLSAFNSREQASIDPMSFLDGIYIEKIENRVQTTLPSFLFPKMPFETLNEALKDSKVTQTFSVSSQLEKEKEGCNSQFNYSLATALWNKSLKAKAQLSIDKKKTKETLQISKIFKKFFQYFYSKKPKISEKFVEERLEGKVVVDKKAEGSLKLISESKKCGK